MHQRVFAFDFDGTLAENGRVPPALQTTLEQLRAAGNVLFLVTGRRFQSVALGSLADIFAGIVWENGAVLYHTATDETYLPFGAVDPRLVTALEVAAVPLEYGQAIVATRIPHDETVWKVLNALGSDTAIVHNKGAVMLLPAGAAKGAGLERLLAICGFSPHNLVSFGDGENDLSMVELGEFGVAVADAVPALKEVADLITTRPGPTGVLEALDAYWLSGRTPAVPQRREHPILLGDDEAGRQICIPGATLAGSNLGVFGDSGSGKSWVTGLVAEEMHRAGYQIVVIDPEGDFRSMRALPGIVALTGDQHEFPTPAVVVSLLELGTMSMVLDLSAYPVSRRGDYVADLLRTVRPLKERKFRPHWIVLEEAQQFLPLGGSAVSDALMPMLAGGGWTFVSYRPDRLAQPVVKTLHHALLTRLTEPESIQTIREILPRCLEHSPAEIPQGYVWLCDHRVARLRPAPRRVPHIRHLYKYFDSPLPAHKRFFFHDGQGYLGLEAASLFEFLQILPRVPLASLAYHLARCDFATWVAGALGDAELAAHLRKLGHRSLNGESLRAALVQRIADRYQELHALR